MAWIYVNICFNFRETLNFSITRVHKLCRRAAKYVYKLWHICSNFGETLYENVCFVTRIDADVYWWITAIVPLTCAHVHACAALASVKFLQGVHTSHKIRLCGIRTLYLMIRESKTDTTTPHSSYSDYHWSTKSCEFSCLHYPPFLSIFFWV